MSALDAVNKRLNLGLIGWPIWALVAGFVYWWWPLDFIPDKYPFVGMMDDVSLIAGLLVATSKRP